MNKILIIFALFIFLLPYDVLFSQDALSNISAQNLVLLNEDISVYVSNLGDIYTVTKSGIIAYLVQADKGYGIKKVYLKQDNKIIKELTETKSKIFNLYFSEDSKWFTYGLREKGKPAIIKLINLEDENIIEINNGDYDCGDIDFAPDNENFVYTRDIGKGNRRSTEIVISDFNQTIHIITNNGRDPKWSPLGDKIAFSKVEQYTNPTEWANYIWLYDIENNIESKLYGSTGMGNGLMSWSPSGKEIASITGSSLLVLDIINESIRKVECGTGTGISGFSWSPDGSKIAFAQSYYGKSNSDDILLDSEIMVVNSDGTGLTNLTNTPSEKEKNPFWIQNKKILFNKVINGNKNIVTYDIGIK
jgi:Tol biopolymer transport system component